MDEYKTMKSFERWNLLCIRLEVWEKEEREEREAEMKEMRIVRMLEGEKRREKSVWCLCWVGVEFVTGLQDNGSQWPHLHRISFLLRFISQWNLPALHATTLNVSTRSGLNCGRRTPRPQLVSQHLLHMASVPTWTPYWSQADSTSAQTHTASPQYPTFTTSFESCLTLSNLHHIKKFVEAEALGNVGGK